MERERRRLVHRYIDGLASLPERREVERDIASDPALAAYVRAHQAVWAQVGAMPDSIANADSAAAIDAFAARISASDAPHTIGASRRLQVVPVQLPPVRRRRTVDWSTIMVFGITAAAVAAIAIGGRGGHVGGAATGRFVGAQRVARASAGTDGEAPVTAIAARGARRTLRLPDGTDIVLGPVSQIRYAPGADGSRTVSLAGEAMFRVVHRAARPFIVRVTGATLEDLGTVFVVRAYAGSPTRVSVQDGRVSLEAAATTMLEPGSSATLDSAGHPAVVHDPVDVGDAFAWTQGSLRYRAAPLADVAADLGRAYDLDIRLADPVLGQRVVQYAIDGEDAHAALDVLVAALAGVGYERHGRVVILYRR
jgi:ferric-dicitrate binding protein FerR (iron transport regulator)